jgi:hypothetical protein
MAKVARENLTLSEFQLKVQDVGDRAVEQQQVQEAKVLPNDNWKNDFVMTKAQDPFSNLFPRPLSQTYFHRMSCYHFKNTGSQ